MDNALERRYELDANAGVSDRRISRGRAHRAGPGREIGSGRPHRSRTASGTRPSTARTPRSSKACSPTSSSRPTATARAATRQRNWHWRASSISRSIRLHLDNFIVKVYRDTAVVWFTQYLVGPVKGKPTEVQYQYMDVWVVRDGRWKAVASQSTRLGSK